jgi:hypothetical protein
VVLAVVVVGTGAGLLASQPWKRLPSALPPPVLRPTGLALQARSTSSVTIDWYGPATGPVPNGYEILQNGTPIGSVPGQTTSYLDTSLAPSTSYSYQVIAIRGAKRSPASGTLVAQTVTPPLTAANLSYQGLVLYTLTSIQPPQNWWSVRVGDNETGNWVFVPACSSGPCDVTLDGFFEDSPFTAKLTRSGTTYSGTAPFDHYWSCVDRSNATNSTLAIQLKITGAETSADVWAASLFTGAVTMNVDYNPNGNCLPYTVKMKIAGSSDVNL